MELENEKRMAQMEADIKHILTYTLEMREELKNMNNTFIPRTELNEMFKNRDSRLDKLEDSKRNIPTWISSIVAIVALAVAYFKG